jgi:hypothetical protein
VWHCRIFFLSLNVCAGFSAGILKVKGKESEPSSDKVVLVFTCLFRLGCEIDRNLVGVIREGELKPSEFLGREDVLPFADGQDTWTHVVGFASSADQSAWLKPDSYKTLIEAVRPRCSAARCPSNIYGFGSWFTAPEDAGYGVVPTWKQGIAGKPDPFEDSFSTLEQRRWTLSTIQLQPRPPAGRRKAQTDE